MLIPIRRHAGLLRFLAVATLPTILLASPAWAGTRIGTLPPGLVAALARQEARTASHNPLDRIGRSGCTLRSREGIKACFGTRTTRIEAGRSRLSLRLVSWGRPGHLRSWARAGERVAANRVQAREEGLVSWWRVLPMGYEEGFTLEHAPRGGDSPGQSPGQVEIVLHSNRTPEEVDGGLSWGRIRYGALWVTDAGGKVLPSRIRVQGRRIELWLDTAGARYPVRVDPLVWVEQALANPSNLASDAEFGSSVAVSGSTAVVGAPGQNSDQGAAYVYAETSGGSWSGPTPLATPSGTSGFGWSVAISGSTIVVGAPYQNSSQGAVYVYTESNGGWGAGTELTLPSALSSTAEFGLSVAVSGSTIVVGAPVQNSSQGAAYVYTGSGSTWTEQTELAIPTGVSTYDDFGYSVAISGTMIVVGTPLLNSNTGAAYVYTESNGSWTEQTELATPTGATGAEFGLSVAISGSTIVVGAPFQGNDGAVYVYTESNGGWTEQTQLATPSGTLYFGYSVAISGSTIVVGAPFQNNEQGAAYVYTETSGSWSGPTSLTTPSGTVLFGNSVAISGTTIVVGAQDQNTGQGAAYVYGSDDLDLVLDTPSSVNTRSDYTSQAILTNKSNYASPALTVRMPIPTGTGYVSASFTQGSCSETSAMLSCDLGSLAASGGSASATLQLLSDATAGTSITNQVSLALSSPALSQSTTTEVVAEPTVTGLSDLSVKVTASTPAAESFSITGTGTLTVSAVSSNPTLLPDSGISVSSGCATSGATCTLTLTPAKGEVGSATVTVTVADTYGDQDSGSFVYTVNDVAPTAQGGSVSTLENTAANGTLSGSAAYAGQTLTYELVGLPSHGTVEISNPATGAFIYVPAPGYVGSDSFTFSVKDGYGTVSHVATETVTVKAAAPTSSGGSSGGGGGFGILDLLALGMIIGLRGMIERRGRSREGLARGA